MKKLLVVIDTQIDFMLPHGKLYVKGAEELIVPGMNFLSTLDPDEYHSVLFTQDSHDRVTYDDSPESEQFPIHCEIGTVGWENVFSPTIVPPSIPVFFMPKGVFDMWEEDDDETEIYCVESEDDDGEVRSEFMNRIVVDFSNRVDIMGVASDFCVKDALTGFLNEGFDVGVFADLTKGIHLSIGEVVDSFEQSIHMRKVA